MRIKPSGISILIWIIVLITGLPRLSAANDPTDSPQQRGFRRPPVAGYYKGRIEPHWLADNSGFWYMNRLSGETREFILVQVETGRRGPAFDHPRLARSLALATGQNIQAEKLPFDTIEFSPDLKEVRFAVDNTTWSCNLESYVCQKSNEPLSAPPQTENRFRRRSGAGYGGPNRRPESPDGQWIAMLKDSNVWVRTSDANESEAIALSTDGTENNAYDLLSWAPQGHVLVAWRIEPGDRKEVYRIESSPPGGGRAVLHTTAYALPGDKFPRYELNLFDIDRHQQIKPDVDRFEHEWERPRLHWCQDQIHFSYMQEDRGHQRLRVIKVNDRTGAVHNVVDERSQTFIWTAHTENLDLQLVNWLDQTDELIYVSEQDGWRHLYLYDVNEARLENQITRGHWVIRGIDRIDEDARQVWFHAGGMNPDQDPYFLHYYRINFDGTGLTALTEGNGNHSIQYSPDRRYLIDTYSRVDMAPVHTLRRVADGSLVCELERADITELIASGWQAPEVFVAKGRDGKTDIWGIICRPKDLDPTQQYPVLENIYAGPQGAYVPKSFSPYSRFSSYTDLGFIVVQMDAMGTAFRSKAFHDVCWRNLKDAGFPDRILWHQAAAKKYHYYDLSRVGIYGVSAGAQNAAAAVLFHPDFYKAAAAACGCHDNRMDKASWNEQWMGYPVGPQYSECSNIDNAGRLGGWLLLIVGEMDDNVPPENTMRFVNALIKADKDFDMLVVPGARHGSGGPFGARKQRDFFVRHLLGQEIPNRNAEQ